MKTMLFVSLFGIFLFFPNNAHATVTVLSSESDTVDEFTAGFVMNFSVESYDDFDLNIETIPTTFTSSSRGGGQIVPFIILFVDGEDVNNSHGFYLLERGQTVVITANWFLQSVEDTAIEFVVESFNYHFNSPDAPLTYYVIDAYGEDVAIQDTLIPEPSSFVFFIGSLGFVLRRRR